MFGVLVLGLDEFLDLGAKSIAGTGDVINEDVQNAGPGRLSRRMNA